MDLFAIFGLGNFPVEYHKNRHNAGFKVLDELQADFDFEDFKHVGKFQCDISGGMFEDRKVLLGKPQTYMNKSGYAVSEIVHFYKIPLSNVLVAFDDIDLPLGEVRFRADGGGGTHNGMKSVIESFGSEQFARVRIGIENRDEIRKAEQDLSSYVLSNFEPGEEALRDTSIYEAVALIKDWLEERK